MTETRLIEMLAALAVATFLVTSSGTAMAPFLQAIATDTGTDLAATANLFSVQALTWGAGALTASALCDRFGRRAILIWGLTGMGLARLGFSTSQSYSVALVWQFLSGVAGGSFFASTFAAVADHVPMERRGRALGWIMIGQSLSLVLGVPMVTLLGALGGWRGALATHGLITLATVIAVRALVPPDPVRPPGHPPSLSFVSAFAKPRLAVLLVAGSMERICFALVALYMPTFLQQSYGVSLAPLAGALALVAAGNLAGNVAGGQLADRVARKMPIFAASMATSALLAVPLTAWHPGLTLSVILGFAYSFVNALGRPSLMATLAEVPSELRGAAFALNTTMASMGWLFGASAGGWLIARLGFVALGCFCAGAGVLGAALALGFSRVARYAKTSPQQKGVRL